MKELGRLRRSRVKRVIVIAAMLLVLTTASAGAFADSLQPTTEWQSPPEELLKVLHAPQIPWVWTAPTGE